MGGRVGSELGGFGRLGGVTDAVGDAGGDAAGGTVAADGEGVGLDLAVALALGAAYAPGVGGMYLCSFCTTVVGGSRPKPGRSYPARPRTGARMLYGTGTGVGTAVGRSAAGVVNFGQAPKRS